MLTPLSLNGRGWVRVKKIMKRFFILSIILLACSAGLYGEEFPQIKGWKANGDIHTYKPANLWEYIDGAANLYLEYNFKLLKLREFQKNNTIVMVEIYDMGTPINAFGIYATERPDDTDLLSIGTEAVVVPPYNALMLKDSFYVKVMIEKGELDLKNGEGILRDVAAFLPGKTDFPDELKLLPEKNIVPGSIKYTTKGYMGLGELNNIVFADYKDPDGNEFRSFVLILPDKKKVDETWKDLAEKWETEIRKGRTVLFREVPYEGLIGVVMSNEMITGVSGIEKKSDLLKLLLGR